MKPILALCIILAFISFDTPQSYSRESENISLSVEEARLIAINNSLEVKLAQLDSKIKGTELSYKEAVFDTILNGEIGYTDDQLKKSSSLLGSKGRTNEYNIGLDKKFRTGTDIEIDFTNKREWTNSAYVSVNPYHESQMGISVTQPISKNFFGLVDRGNIELVKLEIKNVELDSYIKIENAMILAEKAYWGLLLTREEFKIKKEMLKKAVLLFNQHRKKLKIGLIETGDVLASEANMHVRESELLLASNKLKTSEDTLKVRLNLKNEIAIFPVGSLSGVRLDASLVNSLQNAFENRRDYKSAKNDIEHKKIKIEMKKNSLFPEIDLKATFAQNGIDAKYYSAIEDVAEDSNPKYYIGIAFSYPLENNEAESEYEKAKLEKAKTIINLQKTERQIISEIDEKFRNLEVTRINIAKMARVENLQRGKLFQEEKRFKYGRSDSDTIIRYQEDLLNAELASQKAYFDYIVSALELMDTEDTYLKHIGVE